MNQYKVEKKLWSTIFFLLCIDSKKILVKNIMNLPRFSSFLYLFILLSYFITGFVTYFLGLKAVGESVRLPLLYYHVRTYIYLNICLSSYSFLSRKYFLCSTNYSKFHLSKSVIFNVKFWIFLFFSFFVSFYLSFFYLLFSVSFSLFLIFQNNIGSTVNLLNMMDKYDCRSIVFSSSATVSTSLNVHSEKNGKNICM